VGRPVRRPSSRIGARRGAAGAGLVKVPAFAKINLGLEVLGRREDGYHELRTLFQTIDLHDDLLLRPRPSGVVVCCEDPRVPAGEENLAFRAAEALRRHAGLERGVEIQIRKRIPVGGGLGGGSSDAAAVLMALDRLWGLDLGPLGLSPLARRLGADVPYFLTGGTALGLGRGDEVYTLWHQLRLHVVVACPDRPVSTAAVFARLDATLTPRENSLRIYRFVSSDLEAGRAFRILSNELEAAALQEAPDLAERVMRIRGILVREGALLASLTGSGSSYFGLFDDPRRARRARAALIGAGFTTHFGRTLSRNQYSRIWSRSIAAASPARGWGQGRSGQHGNNGRQGHSRRRREAQGVRIDRV
jgi:4-diphosphocytidyl-2-C-methyl-D-erythritol kinase